MWKYIDVHPYVQAALDIGKPVVALESTIIAHGMPFPKNVETARTVEDIIRKKGAVPATIGILGGRIKVGMTPEEILYLAQARDVAKVSRRDFAFVAANALDGAVTVAATMMIAAQAGISVFVTGGIGGVHRGAADSFDISADLEELKQTDVVVVSAGVKSVLDIGCTLEYLETGGVPVITYNSDEFPAFFSRKSGFCTQYRLNSPLEIARLIRTKRDMGLSGGVLVACPIPEKYEIEYKEMDIIIQRALTECAEKNIRGKQITPFLLDKVREMTDGRSLEANIHLIRNNAEAGGEIATALANLSV